MFSRFMETFGINQRNKETIFLDSSIIVYHSRTNIFITLKTLIKNPMKETSKLSYLVIAYVSKCITDKERVCI